MIHVYIHADEAICMQARDKTLKDVGISCFNRIRASNSREGKSMSCFELNMVSLSFTSFIMYSLH